MFLFDDQATLLPNLDRILKHDIPPVQHDPRIMKPLLHFSTGTKKPTRTDRDVVVEGLTYGRGPRIKVTQIDTIPWSRFISGTPKEMGRTPNNSASTNIVELERDLVRFLEAPLPAKHQPTPKPPLAGALHELRLFIRDTLLHELVHFVNHKAGIAWEGEQAGDDAGDWFQAGAKMRRKFPLFFLRPQLIEDTPIPIAMRRNPGDPLLVLLSQ
jgi:hypothetical protein